MFLLFSNSDGLGDPKSLYPSEFILAIPPPHVNRHIAQIPQFFLAIVPKRKKAPEGGLAATLRGKKVRSFLLFGVPDLECYCDVAVSAVRPDNNAKLCPAAIALHVNICSGQFLADFFLNLLQDLINN